MFSHGLSIHATISEPIAPWDLPRHSTLTFNCGSQANTSSQMAPPVIPALPNGTHVSTNGEPENQESEQNASYEHVVDLNEMTRRQLDEDIKAYRYDLNFSTEMMRDANLNLSAQDTRVVQFRILDLGHQIRHCQHRIEQIDAQIVQPVPPTNGQRTFYYDAAPKRRASGMPTNGTPGPASKRPRISNIATDADETIEVEPADGNSVQRLGYWMCHLCTANKYLSAGQNRVPSAPCKWPLRDVSKMLTHFLDMHTEHDPEERCVELGNALAANRGPFEYWLTRTKHQKVRDSDIMDECINSLQAGGVPESLKKINRAASVFPNAMSMKEKAEDSSIVA
ncbi:hypothetical protein SCAR479_07202 [Seiridium cardinale]|uniref:Uncharacterized protein n=1 Tax=Seiridium cardinale TaxID=138064 RepID=A0ABR2XQE4_9PEZI